MWAARRCGASAGQPAKTPQKQATQPNAAQPQGAPNLAAKQQGLPPLVKQAPIQPVNFRPITPTAPAFFT